MNVVVYQFPHTFRFVTFDIFPEFRTSCSKRNASLHLNLAKVCPHRFPIAEEPASYFVTEVTALEDGNIEVWSIDFVRE